MVLNITHYLHSSLTSTTALCHSIDSYYGSTFVDENPVADLLFFFPPQENIRHFAYLFITVQQCGCTSKDTKGEFAFVLLMFAR